MMTKENETHHQFFPSFKSSHYDQFALLGFTGSRSYDLLLTWIFPAAFLERAAVIIILVVILVGTFV